MPLAQGVANQKIGLFGCHPSEIDNAYENGHPAEKNQQWWSGFFIGGGGSGAVTWHPEDIGKQIKLLDDAEAGIPSVLGPGGKVFNVTKGQSGPAEGECDVAFVCYSAYAAEE